MRQGLMKPILFMQVWPTERFEQGAEFMESLAHCFKNAHGFKLKSIFADTLVYMLHPIGKVCIPCHIPFP
jgi:furry protein family